MSHTDESHKTENNIRGFVGQVLQATSNGKLIWATVSKQEILDSQLNQVEFRSILDHD